MFKFKLLLLSFLLGLGSFAQVSFDYDVHIEPIVIPGLPGIHSYAFAQYEGKWLVIGGRLDGLHARQPFNAFPASQNNTQAFVIDIENQQFWSASLSQLPQSVFEQLQSTNMNFIQAADTLYIAGGYAYSQSADDHITFPNLTTIIVSEVINAIINQSSLSPYFKQILDYNFAITGGQLGKIGDTFYLVGGHWFDGQYNPHDNPTFTQTYSNQIRKFKVDNSGMQLSYSNYVTITDPVHLHRRDFNLLPQIFPDGSEGYTISSGVFQIGENLPFLNPIDITAAGHTPVSGFNQYLSNYHSANVSLFDAQENSMHSLFFGGISQYYYQNGQLVQDDLVPFVKTISRISRDAAGDLFEFQLPVEMPGLRGASAEFIPNQSIPHYDSEVIKINEIEGDTITIGHILGGISSPGLNPFSINQTNTTSADATIYRVKLIKQIISDVQLIDGSNPYDFDIYPNPASDRISLSFYLYEPVKVNYFVSSAEGKLLASGRVDANRAGRMEQLLDISALDSTGTMLVTMVFEGKFFVTKKIVKH